MTVDPITDTLYRAFTTTMLFPDTPDMERNCRVLCGFGLAEHVAQGHALGYRITPKGYAEAMAHWGHEQR